MRYLRQSDYASKITAYDLETLLHEEEHPQAILFDSELRAQESISLWLRKRYDLGKLFSVYSDYVSGNSYSTGMTVWYSSTGLEADEFLYSPDYATTLAPPSGWTLTEPRNPLIVEWMVTISLYKLHERVSPDNIPTHRKNAYDEVMMYLKAIQAERVSPDFPEVENRKAYGILISGGTTTGIGYQW
ncbi:hypothetical protein WBG78_28490 [Chryseolinea sp. T2]|uniref:hypothetical protein n=1 Tax=Chryseolinea sp. T2 TaxID=3129255 RepID=UPI00307797CD